MPGIRIRDVYRAGSQQRLPITARRPEIQIIKPVEEGTEEILRIDAATLERLAAEHGMSVQEYTAGISARFRQAMRDVVLHPVKEFNPQPGRSRSEAATNLMSMLGISRESALKLYDRMIAEQQAEAFHDSLEDVEPRKADPSKRRWAIIQATPTFGPHSVQFVLPANHKIIATCPPGPDGVTDYLIEGPMLALTEPKSPPVTRIVMEVRLIDGGPSVELFGSFEFSAEGQVPGLSPKWTIGRWNSYDEMNCAMAIAA